MTASSLAHLCKHRKEKVRAASVAAVTWTADTEEAFDELWQNCPCLSDVSSKENHDRDKTMHQHCAIFMEVRWHTPLQKHMNSLISVIIDPSTGNVYLCWAGLRAVSHEYLFQALTEVHRPYSFVYSKPVDFNLKFVQQKTLVILIQKHC